MAGISVKRWIMGGVAAGIVTWIMEGVASVLWMDDMTAAMESHGLSMEITTGGFVGSVLVSLLVGLTIVFFYAASRPRFGPGPKTAVIVAVALWLGGYVVTLIGYMMLGLFPTSMLLTWGCIGLFELVIAGLIGGWLYQEA